MKKIIVSALLMAMSVAGWSQSALHLTAGSNLFISAGTDVSIDGLRLTPSVGYNITGENRLNRDATATAPAPAQYLSRVYNFLQTLPPYSGDIAIYYKDSELNGLNENNLTLNLSNSSYWTTYAATTVDATNNFVTTEGLNGAVFKRATLGIRGPYITSISSGSGNIGTRASVSGGNFSSTSKVTVNNVAASLFGSPSATSIVFIIPNGAVGGVNEVIVRNDNLISNPVTLTVPSPVITSVSPNSGPVGTSITITGTNFGTGSTVTIGGVSATISGSSLSQISAIVPGSLTAGPHDVIVTKNGIPSNPVNFTVLSPSLTISGLSPGSGAAGTSVTITGTDFTGATGVTFNGIAANSFTVDSDTQITATVPSGATTGNVVVTTAGGNSDGVSFTVLVAPTIVFTNISKTYGDADFNLSATSNSSGAITYSVVSGTGATITPTGAVTITAVGSVVIMASQAADGNYTACEINSTLTISQASNTISFTNPGTKTFGDAAFDLIASATSGGTVIFSIVSGPATISGSTLTLTGAGDVTVKASSGETANYVAAADQSVTFAVQKAHQSITFAAIADKTYGNADFTLSATTSSNLPVTFTATGSATVSGTTVHITSAGPVTITAHQAGNASYEAAPDVAQTFTIGQKPLTPSFTASDKNYDGTATATISGRSLNGGVVGTDVVSLGGSGTAAFGDANAGIGKTVTASGFALTGAAADNYSLTATNATTTATINKATAIVRLTGLTGQAYTGSALSVGSTTTPSGLAVNLTYNGAAQAPTNAASYAVTGTINDANYHGSASGTMVIGKATSTTTVTITGGPFTYTGAAQTPATVTVTGVGGLDLTRDAGYTNNINAGTATASYSYAGDANHEASSDSKTFEIGKANATIAVSGYTGVYDGAAHGATGTARGVTGENLTGLSLGSSFTNVPGGTANWTFDGNTNYNSGNGSVAIQISKANQVITWPAPAAITYGTTVSATQLNADVAGVTGGSAPGSLMYTPGTGALLNAGTHTLQVDAAATTNYNAVRETVTLLVNKKEVIITADNKNKIYDGKTFTGGGGTFTAQYSGFITGENERVLTSGAITYSGTATTAIAANASAYTITPVVNTLLADNYTFTPANGSLTIGKAALSVTANNYSRQYSDQNPTFEGILTGVITGDGITATYATTADAASAPNGYSIVPGLNDPAQKLSNYAVTSTNGTLTVTKEDACATYNSTLFANSNSTTGGTATVRLSVVVTESPDGNSGDVRNANVSFTVGGDFTSGTYAATLDPASTSTQATFYKDITVSLTSTQLSKSGDVSWAISGYYTDATCSEKNTVVTVSAPSADFVTGGGYVTLTTDSKLKYAGDAGTKNNFGFSVKWNKSYSTIQGGGVNTLVRKGNVIYQIKGTKVTALSVTPRTSTTPAVATFTSNAVVNTMDAKTGAFISSEGGCTATVEVTDICEPGAGAKASSDQIAITVRDKNGVVIYANNWDATVKKSIKQTLSGGNIQIRNGSTTGAPTCTSSAATLTNQTVQLNTVMPEATGAKFGLTAYPNPTQDQFKLHVESGNRNDKILLRVFDAYGRTVRLIRDVTAGQTITLGNEYRPGIYYVEMIQGKARMQVKLLKVVY